jgi:hypothetical protein
MDPYGLEPELVSAMSIVEGGLLTTGTTNTNSYGNGFDGQTAPDGIVAFQFDARNGRGVVIEFDAFDVDFAGEILVYLNGVLVGIAAEGADGAMSGGLVNISDDFVLQGLNDLQFVQSGQSDGVWGITNILLSPEPTLSYGTFEEGVFGNRIGGAIETDGMVSFQTFHETTEDLTLFVQGYDIDYYGEVEVFLNGTSLGYLTAGENNELTGSSFDIAATSLLAGDNVISFEVTGNQARSWGVTDLILLNAGTNVSAMALDPEFSDDGWVTWMDINAIYLGRYDTNSGALIEVVNVSQIAPLPFLQTYYGSELIQTVDGMGAIGITAQGLVYVGETETYLLPGTEGYRVGFLPKGELDTLRFTMVDLDYFITDEGPVEVLLYDDGAISVIDFGDPTVRAVTWLNEDDVVVFSATEVGVYDVETGELVWFADNIYEEGYTAALEAANGDSYIVMQSGEYIDIWVSTATGWELLRRVQPPPEVFGIYLYSPELFEWNGRVFLMGISSEVPTTQAETALVLYDIENDGWSQVNPVGFYFDPEVFVLEDGSVALYYRNQSTGTTDWFTIGYDEVMDLAVPGGEPVPAPTTVRAEAPPTAALVTFDSLQRAPERDLTHGHVRGQDSIPGQAPDAGAWQALSFDQRSDPLPDHLVDPLAVLPVLAPIKWPVAERGQDRHSGPPATDEMEARAGADYFDFVPFPDARLKGTGRLPG